MVVTLLANAGHVVKGELTYAMLYMMLEQINNDLNGALKHDKDQLVSLFKSCESKNTAPEDAVIKHTARITSYTATALFHTQNAVTRQTDTVSGV